jgi:hypothetical protein
MTKYSEKALESDKAKGKSVENRKNKKIAGFV